MGCPALNGYPCEPCGAQVQIWRAFCHRRSGAKKILYPYVKNIQSHNPLKMKGKYSTCDITYVHLLSMTGARAIPENAQPTCSMSEKENASWGCSHPQRFRTTLLR